ncbi:MAG: septal ring lytic transglycosylase RlpA family protein [Chitinophagales bacterium]
MKKLLHLIFFLCSFGLPAFSQEAGTASFYHDYFNGKRTASGELYDEKKLTCAHKTLPMGTVLKVTNLDNDKSVIVRVNDRGPYVKGRLLDLSKSAAKILGYLQQGTARVSYEVVSDVAAAPPKDTVTAAPGAPRMMMVTETDTSTHLNFGVKIASYEDAKLAFNIAREMKQQYNEWCFIQSVKLLRGNLYRIFAGNFATAEEAEVLRQKVKKTYPDSYVIEYKNFQ